MGNYESFRTEATVEVDSEQEVWANFTIKELYEAADNTLTEALAKDLSEAAQVILTKDSFILNDGAITWRLLETKQKCRMLKLAD